MSGCHHFLNRLGLLIVILLLFAAGTGSALGNASAEGDRLFAAARFNQAATVYMAAVRANPKDLASHLSLVRTLLRLDNDRWVAAIREGRACVKLAPNHADAHGLLGLALMRGGQPDAAYAQADRALVLDPKSYYGLMAMGRYHLWNSAKEEAKAVLLRAVGLHPEWPDAYAYLLPLFEKKDREQAIKMSKAYFKLNAHGHPHDRLLDNIRGSYFPEENSPTGSKVKSGEKPVVKKHFSDSFADEGAGDSSEDTSAPITFPIERYKGYIIVPMQVNGMPLHILFDTGAGHGLVLTDTVIERLHLQSVGQVLAHGVSGKETSRIYHVHSVQVGSLKHADLEVNSMGELDEQFDGLFGGANFERYVVTVDFKENTMTLRRGKDAAAPAPDEDCHIMTAPLHLLEGYLFVPIRLADRTRTEWALLDTGAGGLGVLSLITARELAKQRNEDSFREITVNERVGIGSSSPSFTALVFDKVAIDLALVNNGGTKFFMEMSPIYGASMIDEQLCRDFDFQMSALIGIDYLANARRVTFDYPHHLLTMEFTN